LLLITLQDSKGAHRLGSRYIFNMTDADHSAALKRHP
jgi:hypothetical protein